MKVAKICQLQGLSEKLHDRVQAGHHQSQGTKHQDNERKRRMGPVSALSQNNPDFRRIRISVRTTG